MSAAVSTVLQVTDASPGPHTWSHLVQPAYPYAGYHLRQRSHQQDHEGYDALRVRPVRIPGLNLQTGQGGRATNRANRQSPPHTPATSSRAFILPLDVPPVLSSVSV
jgi:hypothetical protein